VRTKIGKNRVSHEKYRKSKLGFPLFYMKCIEENLGFPWVLPTMAETKTTLSISLFFLSLVYSWRCMHGFGFYGPTLPISKAYVYSIKASNHISNFQLISTSKHHSLVFMHMMVWVWFHTSMSTMLEWMTLHTKHWADIKWSTIENIDKIHVDRSLTNQ
jgi:hypothetical protein